MKVAVKLRKTVLPLPPGHIPDSEDPKPNQLFNITVLG